MEITNSVRTPTFLVAGVAKCGTTSLYYYMTQHPEIEIPKKETFYFIRDFYRTQTSNINGRRNPEQLIMTEEQYDSFYAKTKSKAIGEVSTCYFHFPEMAIPEIKNKLGDLPVIVILREPVERVWSGYKHFERLNKETLPLEEALASEADRKKNLWDFMWYYTELSFYAKQAARWKSEFKNILFILNEDLEKEPVKTMQEIFRFIGVDDRFVPNTSTRYNISDPQTHNFWFRAFFANQSLKRIIRPLVDKIMNEETRIKIIHKLRRRNTAATPKLDPLIREALRKKYTSDIAALEIIIGKDLSKWK